MKNSEVLITMAQVLGRGWTRTLIEKFLPEPDQIAPNPKYRHAGSPMKLYLLKRVEKKEKSVRFKQAKESSDRRKVAARKAVASKRAKMSQLVAEFDPKIPVYEEAELIRLAQQNFRSLGLPSEVELSDERMCVNYLRHCETPYEQKLSKIFGKTGGRDAYCEIKDKILNEISRKYTWLMLECHRQSMKMWEKRMWEP